MAARPKEVNFMLVCADPDQLRLQCRADAIGMADVKMCMSVVMGWVP